MWTIHFILEFPVQETPFPYYDFDTNIQLSAPVHTLVVVMLLDQEIRYLPAPGN